MQWVMSFRSSDWYFSLIRVRRSHQSPGLMIQSIWCHHTLISASFTAITPFNNNRCKNTRPKLSLVDEVFLLVILNFVVVFCHILFSNWAVFKETYSTPYNNYTVKTMDLYLRFRGDYTLLLRTEWILVKLHAASATGQIEPIGQVWIYYF